VLSTYSAFDDNLRARIGLKSIDQNVLAEEPLYGSLISMGQSPDLSCYLLLGRHQTSEEIVVRESLIDGSYSIRELEGKNVI
jgi:hypothetical protein